MEKKEQRILRREFERQAAQVEHLQRTLDECRRALRGRDLHYFQPEDWAYLPRACRLTREFMRSHARHHAAEAAWRAQLQDALMELRDACAVSMMAEIKSMIDAALAAPSPKERWAAESAEAAKEETNHARP